MSSLVTCAAELWENGVCASLAVNVLPVVGNHFQGLNKWF